MRNHTAVAWAELFILRAWNSSFFSREKGQKCLRTAEEFHRGLKMTEIKELLEVSIGGDLGTIFNYYCVHQRLQITLGAMGIGMLCNLHIPEFAMRRNSLQQLSWDLLVYLDMRPDRSPSHVTWCPHVLVLILSFTKQANRWLRHETDLTWLNGISWAVVSDYFLKKSS